MFTEGDIVRILDDPDNIYTVKSTKHNWAIVQLSGVTLGKHRLINIDQVKKLGNKNIFDINDIPIFDF